MGWLDDELYRLKPIRADTLNSLKWARSISTKSKLISQDLLPDDVDEAPDDAPGVVHRKVDLCSELGRLEVLGSENDVPRGILHVVPGDVAKRESFPLE